MSDATTDAGTFMDLAIAEAAKGRGRTHPNPPVGAVLVKDGRVVGRGFHSRAGLPHAEVEAIAHAGADAARGADLYVTLEPCAHHGRTPPCTKAILDAGIARVFVGSIDPNPLVSGKGVRTLEEAGIPVVTGVRGPQCDALAREFFRLVVDGRPWVTLKVAATLDGRIATRTGDSKWVSSEASRRLVHAWRDEHDAILVGAGTLRADDPQLTTRLDEPVVDGRTPRTPLRVVVSASLKLDPDRRLFDTSAGHVVVACAFDTGEVADRLRAKGVELLVCEALPDASGRLRVRLDALLKRLGGRGVTSVLVEGGAEIHRRFLVEGPWDELKVFVAPKVVGGDAPGWVAPFGLDRMQDAPAFRLVSQERVGEDALLTFAPR